MTGSVEVAVMKCGIGWNKHGKDSHLRLEHRLLIGLNAKATWLSYLGVLDLFLV